MAGSQRAFSDPKAVGLTWASPHWACLDLVWAGPSPLCPQKASMGPARTRLQGKNHLFLPAQLDSVFSQWQQPGRVKFSDLFTDDVFAPFSTLSSKYNLPRSHLFRYFQVHHLIQNHCPTHPSISPSTGFYADLNIPLHLKGVISDVYNTLISVKKY